MVQQRGLISPRREGHRARAWAGGRACARNQLPRLRNSLTFEVHASVGRICFVFQRERLPDRGRRSARGTG